MNAQQHPLRPPFGSAPGTDAVPSYSQATLAPVSEARPGQVDFLRSLFHTLEEAGVCYCVLQRWDALLEELDTDHDVDLAVHPRDAAKLPRVWRELRRRGYQPIQFLNHAVNSYAFVFAWFEGFDLKTVMVDVTFEHRQNGLIWKSGEELVAGRLKQGDLWIADPAIEFAYLLVKKMLKGTFKASRVQRYKLLVERMGRSQAEKVAAELFGEKNKKQVVEACVNGNFGPVLKGLKRPFLWKRYARKPFNVVRYVGADYLRLSRRLFQLTGVSLAVVGSDEAGKIAILGRLLEVLTPAFGSHKVYCPQAWRAPTQRSDARRSGSRQHHSQGALRSTYSLFASFLRFWASYALRIRPLLVRSGLVVFDRCYQEILADGDIAENHAPAWLVRLSHRLAPHPNVLLVLESCSERAADATRAANGQIVEETVREASQVFLDFMASRFESQHVRWAGSAQ